MFSLFLILSTYFSSIVELLISRFSVNEIKAFPIKVQFINFKLICHKNYFTKLKIWTYKLPKILGAYHKYCRTKYWMGSLQINVAIQLYLKWATLSTFNPTHPVGWGYRIRWLHPLSHEVSLRPWVATGNACGWDPSGWAVHDQATRVVTTCNIPFWPWLG